MRFKHRDRHPPPPTDLKVEGRPVRLEAGDGVEGHDVLVVMEDGDDGDDVLLDPVLHPPHHPHAAVCNQKYVQLSGISV